MGRPPKFLYDQEVVDQLTRQLAALPDDPEQAAQFLLRNKIIQPKLRLEVVPGAAKGDVPNVDDIVVEHYWPGTALPRTAWRVIDTSGIHRSIHFPTVELRSLTSGQTRHARIERLTRVRLT